MRGSGVWAWWALAGGAAGAVGMMGLDDVASPLRGSFDSRILVFLATWQMLGGWIGLALGAAQWLTLRHLIVSPMWVPFPCGSPSPP